MSFSPGSTAVRGDGDKVTQGNRGMEEFGLRGISRQMKSIDYSSYILVLQQPDMDCCWSDNVIGVLTA